MYHNVEKKRKKVEIIEIEVPIGKKKEYKQLIDNVIKDINHVVRLEKRRKNESKS